MKNATQMTLGGLGALSGTEKAEPICVGDMIVNHTGRRFVVESVDSDIHGAVYMCVALNNGASCVVLEREIAYRARYATLG